jgi:hypothetical protein
MASGRARSLQGLSTEATTGAFHYDFRKQTALYTWLPFFGPIWRGFHEWHTVRGSTRQTISRTEELRILDQFVERETFDLGKLIALAQKSLPGAHTGYSRTDGVDDIHSITVRC